MSDCQEGRCTLIHCTVGPLLKDQSVIFKIRSRLFTKTQIEVWAMLSYSRPFRGGSKFALFAPHFQNYANKVKISSKLVTRITRLPFQADVRKVEYQVDD